MQRAYDPELLVRIASLASTLVTPKQLPPWYRPVIAVPTSGFTSQHGRWRMDGVESAIGQALYDAGADACYFPCRPIKPRESPFDAVWQVVRRADAIIVPGGINEMLPGWFTHSTAVQTGSVEWWEDWWRWHLTQLSLLLCMPLLGIDEGAGYLNVVLGGELYRDIKAEVPSYGRHMAGPHADADEWIYNAFEILHPTSYIASCANNEPYIWGACMHRHAVRTLAPDLAETACSMDRLPEVVERTDGFFGIGLWSHPEQSDVYDTQQYPRNLFATLHEAAMTYASSQSSRHQQKLDDLRDDIWSYLSKAASTATTPRLIPASPPPGEKKQNESSAHVTSTGYTPAPRAVPPQSTDAITTV